MKTITDIIMAYTMGKLPVDQANNLLEKVGDKVRLDPAKNILTPGDLQQTTVGAYASQANGWGLLFTGTGLPDKVKVEKGVVKGFDAGCMPAEVIICGRKYDVKGSVLSDI